jgi:quaternary ammonium compound-resistance protein SugE
LQSGRSAIVTLPLLGRSGAPHRVFYQQPNSQTSAAKHIAKPQITRSIGSHHMNWIYLVLAGLFEIGWPVGLKMAQTPSMRTTGLLIAVVFMGISGFLLWLAQRTIPIGTAYAIWTGIGAAGTFLVGVMIYNDPASVARFAGVALIIAGVVTLKLAH